MRVSPSQQTARGTSLRAVNQEKEDPVLLCARCASVRIISPSLLIIILGGCAGPNDVLYKPHVELEESQEQLLGQFPQPRGPGTGHTLLLIQELGITCSQVGQLGLPATASWVLSECLASHPFSTGALKYHPTLSSGNSRFYWIFRSHFSTRQLWVRLGLTCSLACETWAGAFPEALGSSSAVLARCLAHREGSMPFY